MKALLYVRALSPFEHAGIETGLRFSGALTLRRSQILLASSREQGPSAIARSLGCATQTVRNAIHAFELEGLDCLKQESSRPKTVQAQVYQARVRIIPCWLPTESPWLNRIEPTWVHGKRAIVEPARLLTAQEVRQRVCNYFGCEQLEPLSL